MNILSLGAGVQSSTLALMAAKGEINPMPDAAIFADTGWEPKHVYKYLDWLEQKLPFPVYRVMHKNGLLADLMSSGRFASVPFFTADGGMSKRQCTAEYKLIPIRKKMRLLLGFKPRQRIPENSVTCWIGISLDESIRMKPSRDKWVTNRWPLIELGMTRGHCLEWINNNRYPTPPKSSCLGCPYHSNKHWAEIKSGDQSEWQHTVEMDRHIRKRASKMRAYQYMHQSLKPLDEVDFTAITNQTDIFVNECEGICGV